MQKVSKELEVDDSFLDGQILAAAQDLITWFADYAIYLASDQVLEDPSY